MVLALAEKLEVLPKDLGGLLTAIVLITMAVTPLLGQAAAIASEKFVFSTVSNEVIEMAEESQVAEDAVVICGYKEVGKEIINKLGTVCASAEINGAGKGTNLPKIVAFDTEPSLINNVLLPSTDVAVMYGDGANPEVFRSHGVNNPRAIFISYEHHEQVMAATSRLRTSFVDAPIYTRAQSREEAEQLRCCGATEVVVELDELPRSSPYLLLADETCRMDGEETSIPIRNLLNVTEVKP